MNVLARFDIARCPANDRVVLADEFALRDPPRGDLVAGRHLRAQAHRDAVNRQVRPKR